MDIAFIREKIRKEEYDLSLHAHNERQEEQITIEEIENVLLKGDIIEQYPNDPRGESCLVVAIIFKKPLHVVCGMRGSRMLVITVYRPKRPVWINYKTRVEEVKSRE